MDDKLVKAIFEEYGMSCIICGDSNIELHHVVGGIGKRKQYENKYSIVPLCYWHHRGTKGVHGRDGRSLDLYLKRMLQQKYFMMGYSEDTVRVLMGGKLY